MLFFLQIGGTYLFRKKSYITPYRQLPVPTRGGQGKRDGLDRD